MANKPEEAMSLKGLFQGLIPDPGGVIQGVVKSASPLKIQVTNDEKLTLNENSLIVPRHLSDYTTTVDISGGTVSGSTSSDGSHDHSYSGSTESDGHSHSVSGTAASGGDPEHTHSISGNASESSHSHGYSGDTGNAGGHSHSITSFSVSGARMTVHNALKVGETVHLLSFNGGKQYYVLDRVV